MKNIMHKSLLIILSVLTIMTIGSCAAAFQPIEPAAAKVGAATKINKTLTSLPAPKEKIVATVYKFRDQTGQYKSTENGSSWSTAVTQGATTILTKALEESNWFVVIEREGLSNLLNERKIIRSSRANYQAEIGEEDQQLLPPLLYAGIILEGGIISYDSNILTGGIGLKYFGAGASNQYREDRISVYLRAISTQSGRVLLTVYTTKTILSQLIDVSFFRFVKFKRLLEAETGYSHNEPGEMCVKEAIEKAVQNLILEGALMNLWALKDSSDMNDKVFQDYLKEKNEAENVDVYEKEIVSRNSVGIGSSLGYQLYSGDVAKSLYTNSGDIAIKIPLDRNLGLTIGYLGGEVASRNYFSSTISSLEFNLDYKFLPENKLCPFLKFGGGLAKYQFVDRTNASLNKVSKWIPQLVIGLGTEYLLSPNFGVNVILDNHYFFDDNLDGKKLGEYNDFYWGARFGFVYYFSF